MLSTHAGVGCSTGKDASEDKWNECESQYTGTAVYERNPVKTAWQLCLYLLMFMSAFIISAFIFVTS